MSSRRSYYVYILTNPRRTVLYTGVTNDLGRRAAEHTQKQRPSFTARYNVSELVYFESHANINDAIAREKQIKGGSRQKKLDLIDAFNPEWKDFADEAWLLGPP